MQFLLIILVCTLFTIYYMKHGQRSTILRPHQQKNIRISLQLDSGGVSSTRVSRQVFDLINTHPFLNTVRKLFRYWCFVCFKHYHHWPFSYHTKRADFEYFCVLIERKRRLQKATGAMRGLYHHGCSMWMAARNLLTVDWWRNHFAPYSTFWFLVAPT